jgi:two-component system phosphate regulon response regulator OmpR
MTSFSSQRAEPLPDDAPHVLIVDDDQKIRDLLARYLFAQGFRVTTAADAECARASLRGLDFDILLLDVMMPGISGLELAREIKAVRDIPICMLTARAEPEQRIEGLEIGVDDYVPKPFEPRELLLRLRNILRRGQQAAQAAQAAQPPPSDEVRMGTFVFHIARGELKRNNETIKLTERERDLLRQFAQKRGLPIQRHELTTDETTGNDRAIDVQINRLRRKIETDPSNPVYLQTVRGKGYILYTD